MSEEKFKNQGDSFVIKKVFVLSIILLFATSCKNEIHRVSRPLLGTIINLTIMADEETASKASDAVFTEIERIENLMSPVRKTSDVYKMNHLTGMKSLKISSETMKLLEISKKVSEETSGAFDISFASISHLWNWRSEKFIPPSKETVQKNLPLVNYRNIKLPPENSTVKFARKGMKIGLGGIAKGYAVRRGLEVLKEHGVRGGIVEEGGDLQVTGTNNGRKWRTGLMHPREKKLILAIDLEDGESIATSGDYERGKTYQGKRYHHIIDPRTGFPTETFASVSVISKDPVLSDSYATAIFVMGLKDSKKFLKKHPEIKVVLIDQDMKIYISKELKDRIVNLADVPFTEI